METLHTRNCPSCNEIIFHSSISSKSHCKNNICRKCSDKNKSRANYGHLNGKWSGFNDISNSYFNEIKYRSNKRNHTFEITMEDMWERFNIQNKKCVYTGIELTLPKRGKGYKLGTASLDRIDSSKGYVKENIQWVHKDINWMKQDFDQTYFIKMCDLVSNMFDVMTPIDIFIKDNKITKNL